MDSVPAATTPHVIMLPFPHKSHINPMMNLAQYLASLGIHVTFLYYGRPASADIRKKILEHLAQFSGSQYLRVVVVPKGLSDDETSYRVNTMILKESLSAMAKQTELAIDKATRSERPVTSLVCDTLYGMWPQDLADKFGIPRAEFSTSTATNYMLCWNLCPLIARVTANNTQMQDEIITTCLPDVFPTLRATDLPSYFHQGQPTDAFQLEDCVQAYGHGKDAKWVLIHTCYELEASVIDALRAEKVPVHAVGPLLPPSERSAADNATSRKSSADDVNGMGPTSVHDFPLLGHTDECLRWLDTQSHSSVLYVALGTTGSWSPSEIQALAHGIEDSQMPFLWVLPSNYMVVVDGSTILSSISSVLPEGFEARMKHRSLMVSRAPQLAVLAHPSVGGFLTHCEWNSILEGMYYGVPMAGLAGSADQVINLRLMTREWKVGVGIERSIGDGGGGVQRQDVERAVRAVMRTGSGGGEAGHDAIEEEVDARRAVTEASSVVRHSRWTGSSKTNLDAFVHGLWDNIRNVSSHQQQM